MATNSLRFGYCYGNGSRGPRGTPGPPGMHGPTGATGPGISALCAYGELYDIYDASTAAINTYVWSTTSISEKLITALSDGERSEMNYLNNDLNYGDALQAIYAGPYQIVLSARIEPDFNDDVYLGIYVNGVLDPKTKSLLLRTDSAEVKTVSATFLMELSANDVICAKLITAVPSAGTKQISMHYFNMNVTSLRGVINLYGATGPPQINSGLTGATGPPGQGPTGPFSVSSLIFDSDDLFTYTPVPDICGGGAVIGNLVADYLFSQPPPVQNHGLLGPVVTPVPHVELSWDQNTPSTTATAFSVAPSNLGTNFDWLPYINGFTFEYQQDGSSVWHTIQPGSGNYNSPSEAIWKAYVDSNVTGSGGPNELNQVFFQAQSISGGVSITNPDVSLANPLIVDIGQGDGIGNAYRMRFAFINSASGEPNWVYWPDNSGGALQFVPYGPAYPPTALEISSNNFNSLNLSGMGNPAGMDQTYSTSYGSAFLNVRYGGNITGSKRLAPIQWPLSGPSVPLATITSPFLSNYTNQGEPWGILDVSNLARSEYNYVADLSLDPAFEDYYCQNDSTDSSFIKQYMPAPGIISTSLVPIPKKSDLNTLFDTLLEGSFNGLNITNSTSSTGLVTTQAYQRTVSGDYILHDDVNFVNVNEKINIEPSNNFFTCSVNSGDSTGETTSWITPPDSCIGKFTGYGAIPPQNLCYFKLGIDSNSSTLQTLSGSWIAGDLLGNVFSGATSHGAGGPGSNLEFTATNNGDITTNSFYRGYYIGATVLNTKAKDLSLDLVPDICNNGVDPSGKYLPHIYSLGQQYRADYNVATESTKVIEESFSVGRKPINSITVNNWNANMISATSAPRYFYGLQLPHDIVVDVTYDVDNIDPTWAPTDDDILYQNELIIDPVGLSEKVDDFSYNWNQSATNTTVQSTAASALHCAEHPLGGGPDFLLKPYSRDILYSDPQFKVVTKIPYNNVALSASIPDISSTDISQNGQPHWWDYTWTDNSFGGCPNNSLGLYYAPTPIFAMDFSNQSEIGCKLDTSGIEKVRLSYPFNNCPTDCDFSNQPQPPQRRQADFAEILSYNEAMWAKQKWYGANTSGVGQPGPYISYDASYVNHVTPNPSGGLHDYRPLDPSGDTFVYSLGATMTYSLNTSDISGAGTEKIKWIMMEMSTPANVGNLGVEIDGYHPLNDQKVYNDYWLFYMEEDISGSGTSYGWWEYDNTASPPQFVSLGTRDNTPWLDCGNVLSGGGPFPFLSFRDAQAFPANPGVFNGCITANQSATNFIKCFNPTVPLKRYIAIGLKETTNIGKITLSVGTN